MRWTIIDDTGPKELNLHFLVKTPVFRTNCLALNDCCIIWGFRILTILKIRIRTRSSWICNDNILQQSKQICNTNKNCNILNKYYSINRFTVNPISNFWYDCLNMYTYELQIRLFKQVHLETSGKIV
jgi:hypothetical protein